MGRDMTLDKKWPKAINKEDRILIAREAINQVINSIDKLKVEALLLRKFISDILIELDDMVNCMVGIDWNIEKLIDKKFDNYTLSLCMSLFDCYAYHYNLINVCITNTDPKVEFIETRIRQIFARKKSWRRAAR
jgi:hypothetical protein